MDYEEITYEEGNDWVERIYTEDGIKITRYKPSWYKDPDKCQTAMRSKPRKPVFGPKDP